MGSFKTECAPLRWLRPLVALPLVLSSAATAQSINQGVVSLETCFKAARVADTICEKETDPEKRLSCFENARTAQLECLTHVLPQEPVVSKNPAETPPSSSAQTPEAAEQPISKENSATGSLNTSTANNTHDNSPNTEVKKDPSEGAETRDTPTAAVQSNTKAITETDASSSPTKNWIISETTSPVDFSPLVIAGIQPTQPVENGVTSLTIRCRGNRTEVSGQFQASSNPSKIGDIRIEYQINDQSPVKAQWSWSADGKSAVYESDPVPLLESIPDGATLKIGRSDKGGVQQGAAFHLIGLDSVRRRVAGACKWSPLQAKAPPEKR